MCLKLMRTTFSYHFTDVALFLHPFNPLSSSYVLSVKTSYIMCVKTSYRAESMVNLGFWALL